ncbi:MAG: Gfo/Idh/MocA family oxidoreductase [Acetatifactor sp.]|nr:Gfo/Idh/MocA family oxidoreductase [Acetatifactor sp.]
MEPIKVIVLGAGRRGTDAYAPYALKNPDKLQIVGVADPSDIRREHMRRLHDIPAENCFVSWQACLQRQKFADAVFICTQDQMHFEPTMKAIEAGYDILLEKPIAPTARECSLIEQAARKAGVRVLVCHVLRYANHYRKVKEIVDSGLIGEIVHINHIEAVGDYHQAHSYV